jgi:hypothetical protein
MRFDVEFRRHDAVDAPVLGARANALLGIRQ